MSFNLTQLRTQVDQACRAAGRDPDDVRILPVSKTHRVELIREAVAAGYTSFAENRVQELAAKALELPEISWVLIGHLQRNKVGLACRVISELQSLDSLRLAAAIDNHYEKENSDQVLDCLVEVNTSGEATKMGVHPSEVMDITAKLRAYPHL
ncbi:MAG: alanine racemase, partial [Propionibacteriaceae bacterium]|nr:alanine racemase [Propionibacteriaceae bacterium]